MSTVLSRSVPSSVSEMKKWTRSWLRLKSRKSKAQRQSIFPMTSVLVQSMNDGKGRGMHYRTHLPDILQSVSRQKLISTSPFHAISTINMNTYLQQVELPQSKYITRQSSSRLIPPLSHRTEILTIRSDVRHPDPTFHLKLHCHGNACALPRGDPRERQLYQKMTTTI